MAKTGAELLVERLLAWGVDTIFSLPGDGINGIYEALRTHQEKIKLVLVRHEEAAAFMACGYAKFTGKLGVCLATRAAFTCSMASTMPNMTGSQCWLSPAAPPTT